jgi:hypothetical protein
VLTDRHGAFTPDMAALIDQEDEIIADELGITLHQARMVIQIRDAAAIRHQAEILAKVIGLLVRARNMPVMVHSLAIAFGLEELNGAHSQSEIARQLGVTRALVSHYVVGWRDVLAGGFGAFDCTKFRKRNDTRQIYAKSATNPVLEAKRNKRNANTK